jgi:hypothetical protein
MNKLDRYVIRAVLGGVFVVLAVLLALGALFTFAGQQDDIGEGSYTALDALWFVLLNLPQQMYETMPIAVMIARCLGSLARGSELTVMRAAGISVWRIAGSVAWPCCWYSSRCCGEFIAPPLVAMAKQRSCSPSFPPSHSRAVQVPGARRKSADQCFPAVRARRIWRHAHFRTDRGSRTEIRGHCDHGQSAGRRQLETSHYASTTFGGERIESRTGDREFASTVGGDFLALTVSSPRQLETACCGT